MDAAEFFRSVVRANYDEFTRNPGDLRSLWNAVVSANTAAEFVALHQLGYPETSRAKLDAVAKSIRDKFTVLSDLKFCAETFKHVRKITDQRSSGSFTTVASSTGISPMDRTTWKIDPHDVVSVLELALATLELFRVLEP